MRQGTMPQIAAMENMMQITIDISDDLRAAVAQAAKAAFHPESGYRSGAAGYDVIRRQVDAALKAADYSTEIADAIQKLLPDLLEDTVRAALQARVKETIRKMQQRGDLAAMIDAAGS